MENEKKFRLAVTEEELLAEGIPLRRLAGVMARLRRMVRQAPQLNNYPTLTALARQICFWEGTRRFAPLPAHARLHVQLNSLKVTLTRK